MISTKELKGLCVLFDEQAIESLMISAHRLGMNYVLIDKTERNVKIAEDLRKLGYNIIIGYGDVARIKISW